MKWWDSLQDPENLNFPALFDISIWISRSFWRLGNFNLNFTALYVGQEQKRKSAGKFKFPESYSEVHHFIHSLCFSKSKCLTFEWKLLGLGKLEPELDLERLSYSFNNCNFKCDRLLGDAEGVTHRSIRSKSSSTSLLAPASSRSTPFSSFILDPSPSSPLSPPSPFLLFRPIFKTFNSLICNEEVENKVWKDVELFMLKRVGVEKHQKSSFLCLFYVFLKVRCTVHTHELSNSHFPSLTI